MFGICQYGCCLVQYVVSVLWADFVPQPGAISNSVSAAHRLYKRLSSIMSSALAGM